MLNAPIDLDDLLSYSLSPVPHCLGNHDGFFSKTNKESMLQFLMEDYNADVQYLKDSMFIHDGNSLFYTLVNLPPTFGGICLQSLNLMVSKKSFIFSTDFTFKVKVEEIHSIKSNQEETDTRIVLYIKCAESLGFPTAVVRTPDSDIFFYSTLPR